MDSLAVGDTVDRYKLVKQLGEGGQGSVWRAEDPLSPGKDIALKLVSLLVVPGPAIDRLRREARALARLSHPSLPRCHAFFEDLHKDVLGFALDLVEGEPLSTLASKDTLTSEQRLWILHHLADALRYIHEAGLVHRDLKLENVMIDRAFASHPEDPAGVKLVDFGIAAATNNPAPLTQRGSVIGTTELLAPELLDPSFWKEPSGGPERDVFAFGVVAWELLHGGVHPTGLETASPPGDYLVAYRQKADHPNEWPPGCKGDKYEAFFRKVLALKSSKRAQNGEELVALLKKEGPPAPLPETIRAAPATATPRDPSRTLESARPDPNAQPVRKPRVAPAIPATAPRQSFRRLYMILGGISLAGFGIGFFVTYSQPAEGSARMPSSSQEEPPPLDAPAKPTPRLGGPAPRSSTPTKVENTATTAGAGNAAAPEPPPSCPADMAPIAGWPGFCIDKHEVTVHDYCGDGPCDAVKTAYWPGAPAAALEEQKGNCTANRAPMAGKPITCVTWTDAQHWCSAKGKRLPTMKEWALAGTAVSLCHDGEHACPLFEWSSDSAQVPGGPYRQTRGPSWRHLDLASGKNPEGARNDDLGFRCAK